MNVASILKDKGAAVVTVPSHTTVGEAAQVLSARRIGAVVVVEDGAIAGVLSERDIVRALAGDGAAAINCAVADYMTETVHVCGPEDSINRLMAQMTRGRFRHVPVLGEDGALIGIVSIGDVVKRKIEDSEREVVALREYIAYG